MKIQRPIRSIFLPIMAIALLLGVGCSKDELRDPFPTSIEKEVTVRSSNYNFTASLKGDNEVPPVETNATGLVKVKISQDESSIYYKLIVANIDDVRASHFHMAPEGSNGPVVALLYSNPDQPSGPSNGVIAEGTITAENVVGPLAGDLAALIDRIRTGKIYVNVHTAQVPSGEIRGQL